MRPVVEPMGDIVIGQHVPHSRSQDLAATMDEHPVKKHDTALGYLHRNFLGDFTTGGIASELLIDGVVVIPLMKFGTIEKICLRQKPLFV
jgi:hypothetical protein